MENKNIGEKISELKNFLKDCDWEFKKYIASDVYNSLLENEDTIIDALNTVREFYATESLILTCGKDVDVVDLKESISQVSELHDLLLKLEFIYVYKLTDILEIPNCSDNSDRLLEFIILCRGIEEILFFFWDVFDRYWDNFFEYMYEFDWYYWRTRRDLRENLVHGVLDERGIEFLIFLTRNLSKVFSGRINALQNSMLSLDGSLHFVNIRNTRIFHKRFPQRIKKYLSNPDDKIYKKAFESSNISCYATIEFDGEKYIAVNGIALDGNKNRILNEFKKVLESFDKKSVKIVDIADGVRYYLNDLKRYIEYKDFVSQNVDKKNRRMFTCCERKLFAKLREENNGVEIKDISTRQKIHLSTTKSPCAMCQREIKVNSYKINTSTLDTTPQNMNLTAYDTIAEGIFDRI